MHRDIEKAAKLHRSGRTKEALTILQALAKQHPLDPSISVNYGLLLLESGNASKAKQRLKRVLNRHADYPPAQYAMGQLFIHSNRPQLASRHFQIASELEPLNRSNWLELANSFQLGGNIENAISSVRKGLSYIPEDVGFLNLLAKFQIENKSFGDAVKTFKQVTFIEPNNPAAQFNLAKAFRKQGNDEQAENSYRRALELKPNFSEALLSFGIMLKENARLQEAGLKFEELVKLIHSTPDIVAHDVFEGKPPVGATDEIFKSTSALKLDHDIQQLTYLLGKGKIPEHYKQELAKYIEVRNSINLHDSGQVVVPLSDEQFRDIGNSYNRAIYLYPSVGNDADPINSDLDVTALEASFMESVPNMAVVDDFLTPEALHEIRTQCLESTFWYDYRHKGGYLGVGISEGFLSPLLVSIAENMRARFPNIFLEHQLRQAWAFKYDSRYRGTGIHADFAAVNVNFWITPDEANLNPNGGGLVIFKHEAPMDWDFAEYNGQPEKIYEFLEEKKSARITVPYHQNRAVIFNSNLFHKTDDIDFCPGYENRRINITMLFGLRQYK